MKNSYLIYIFFGMIFLTSCQNEDQFTPRIYPFISSTGVNSIDETGTSLDFELKDFGLDQITSYGIEFLETELVENRFNTEQFYIREIKGKPDGERVTIKLTSDLVPNRNYVAYPFVKTGTSKITGKGIRFTAKGSSPPQILRISKTVLGLNSFFEIIGKNFSSKKGFNTVEIPGAAEFFSVNVLDYATDTLIIGAFTQNYYKGDPDRKFDLKVITRNQFVIEPAHFSIDYPKILAINMLDVKSGDEVIVTLNLENDPTILYFTLNWGLSNSFPLTLQKIGDNLYKTNILNDIPAGKYKVGLFAAQGYTSKNISIGGSTHVEYDQELIVRE